ncbi:MAG TPA: 1-acyl-sn-glycerol-3-phosphate acyltransferase [bacterium]|nr:1-acyl-sn-glycerol-3-phosphate acyltransferase [bacterium]
MVPFGGVDVRQVLTTGAWVVGGIAVYELVRSSLLRAASRRLDRNVDRYVRERAIRLDRYKFAGRDYVKTEVLNDPGMVEAIVAAAAAEGRTFDDVRDDVDRWLDEIVPAFNPFAYYRFGYVLARTVLNFAFETLVDHESLDRARAKIPEGAAVVYVFNHRSNADFVFASVALASSIALSYAVGEWARVWPLDALFRRFGAYFVRRGFKNPLYHRTLAKYVQLIVRRGVTQGVFPEGGLSRDGALRPPKLGIVEYIASLKADPAFRHDVVFIPVGLNYDRVLEDHSLLAEAKGGVELGKDTLGSRLRTGWLILKRLPSTLAVNAFRAATGRTGRYGYAAVSFGDPVSLSSYLVALGEDVFSLPLEPRRERIRRFAEILMAEIARRIPATPATAVAAALAAREPGAPAPTVRELREALVARIAEWRRAGRFVAQGREFHDISGARRRLAAGAEEERRAELLAEESSMVAADEAQLMARLGLEFLAHRGALLLEGGGADARVVVRDADVLRYYAASLDRLTAPAVAVATAAAR